MQVHPSQISPGEPFDVFYFLRNPTDSTTYYVRAVVYDVQTGEVLDTQNLIQTATNAHLFIKRFQAPPDPTGYGRNIVAIASVYTDSGYTTKSDNYEEQESYFLIKAQAPVLGGGGVDYRIVRDIIQEELGKLPKPPELNVPNEPDMSFVDALFGAIGALQREVNRIPKDAADLEPLRTQLDAIRTAIVNLPAPQKFDLSGIALGIDALSDELTTLRGELKQGNLNVIQAVTATLSKITEEIVPTLQETMDRTLAENELSVSLPASFSPRVARPTRKSVSTPDVSSLMKA
jgi:hypothetical protein